MFKGSVGLRVSFSFLGLFGVDLKKEDIRLIHGVQGLEYSIIGTCGVYGSACVGIHIIGMVVFGAVCWSPLFMESTVSALGFQGLMIWGLGSRFGLGIQGFGFAAWGLTFLV